MSRILLEGQIKAYVYLNHFTLDLMPLSLTYWSYSFMIVLVNLIQAHINSSFERQC